MALYLLSLPNAIDKIDGVVATIVEANTSAEAKALANSKLGGDGDWASATVTTLSAGQASDFSGWKYRITIGPSAAFPATSAKPNPVQVEYVGVGSDTVDLIGAALVTALNATPQIAGAAYNTSTNVLTIAETTDDTGDSTVVVEIFAPGCADPIGSSMYSSLVHQGAHGDALKVTLTSPSAIPAIVARI